MLLSVFCALQVSSDTLKVRTVARPPRPEEIIDSARYGAPQVRIRTGQRTALAVLGTDRAGGGWEVRRDDPMAWGLSCGSIRLGLLGMRSPRIG